MPGLRLPRQEIGQRGDEIYLTTLRGVLEPRCNGQFVAIDVESHDYEVADEAMDASDRLRQRHINAQVLVKRVGFPASFFARGARS